MNRARGHHGQLLLDLLVIVAVGAILAGGFLLLKPRSAVDWRAARAVVIESDDWGLCGFTPTEDALDGVDIDVICPGEFPDVYLYSTLECRETVERMAALLAGHRGRDDVAAVFQPNYIMSSLSYAATSETSDVLQWRQATLPRLPALYSRDDLWPAVHRAIGEGVWWPEYHGMWHYDPDGRRTTVAVNGEAMVAARRGLLIFPGGSRSFELALHRDPEILLAELRTGLTAFESLFGRPPTSIIAPDYAWTRACELMWLDEGLRIIQAKREQRPLSKIHASMWDRFWKVCERSWRYLIEKKIVYLNRNCRLEGSQVADARAHAAACLASVRRAWNAGEPAIVGTHRVNYAHLDPASVDVGFAALAQVLEGFGEDVAAAPIYLTDNETAQLTRKGTSLRDTGRRRILRNLTHSRRPVLMPTTDGRSLRAVWLNPGETLQVDLQYHTDD